MKINDILVEFASGGSGDSGNYFKELASAWYNGTFDTGSLQKGIKTQEDVERLLNRGIVCPDGKTRKLHIDYNSDFDGVEIYSDDYYEYGDHDDTIDSRTGQKWGPYDFMAFSDEDLSEGLNEFVTPQAVAQDPGLEREKDVDVIFFGRMPRDYRAEDAWAALEEVLPAEYPSGSERAQLKTAEVAKSGGAVVTTKPLSIAKKLVATFTGYGIKSRINGNLNEFAADDGDSGGEEDILHKYARMWWAGDDATQQQIEKVLARMGWEIGEDEGGYDNGGVFVVRAGDENGDSYTSWAAEDLTEGVWDNIKKSFTPDPNWQKRAGQAAGHVAQGAVAGGAHGHAVGHAMADTGVHEGDLNEKSTSQAQFRIMAAAAHDPKFARKVGIKQSVAREFNRADKEQDYKSLPKKATEGAPVTTTPGSIEPGGAVDNFKQQMANNTEIAYKKGMAEGNKKPEPPEADYGPAYQDMVQRVKRLAGLGPLKTQYDPQKRVYRNMPTAVQPRK